MAKGKEVSIRRGPRRLPRLLLGFGTVGTGALLLLLSVGYLTYARWARAHLPDLEVEAALGTGSAGGLAFSHLQATEAAPPSPALASASVERNPRSDNSAAPLRPPVTQAASAALYPGERITPSFWLSPLWAEPLPGEDLVGSYRPVEWRTLPAPGTLPRAQSIRIPAIDVDSSLMELGIVDLGDSRYYETPPFVVGHIPETANPGELGGAWFFGHLESPIRDEGNVFRDLPKIPGLLRQGFPVYIFLEGPAGSFLYQVTRTRVVHQDKLFIEPSTEPTVTLVTCIPLLVYDQRLVVTARLVGGK